MMHGSRLTDLAVRRSSRSRFTTPPDLLSLTTEISFFSCVQSVIDYLLTQQASSTLTLNSLVTWLNSLSCSRTKTALALSDRIEWT